MDKLNLGSGHDYRKGYVNLDIGKKDVYGNDVKADVYHNLNNYPYPFKNNQFDEIYMEGILEHIQDLKKHIKQLSRISKSGCVIKIRVPYFLSYFAGREIYTHKFSLNCVQLFGIFKKNGFKLVKKKLIISRNPLLRWLNFFANISESTKNFTERFPIIIPVGVDWEFLKEISRTSNIGFGKIRERK